MPTIEISKKDLEMLVGKKLSIDELDKKAMPFVKADISEAQGDALRLEIKDTNRPDLLSVEGIARELRGLYGKSLGLPRFKVYNGNVSVDVDPKLIGIRPRGAYAIAKNVKVTEHFLKQMIQLQEKICETFGRKRKEIAIGLFDYDKISGNLKYYAADPSTKFVPLDFKEKLTLKEILELHPKGQEYGKLISSFKKYPLLVDAKGEVLSMPPIINSDYSGKVTTRTRNLFIDITGFDQKIINTALDIVCAALYDRGARIESVLVKYKDEQILTPHMRPRKIKVPLSLIESIWGEKVASNRLKMFAAMKRMDCRINKGFMEVLYGSYRADILHAVDIVEDLLIASDYNKLKPEKVLIPCRGAELKERRDINALREVCIGLGLQEVLTYTLTSKEKQSKYMLLSDADLVELENPVSSEYSVIRKSILPELLSMLSKNKHREYPQKVFEVGKVVVKKNDDFEEKTLVSIAISHPKANFNEIKSIFDSICDSMGLKYKVEKTDQPSFEKGFCAIAKIDNKIAALGVVRREVLKNFGLEMPVAALEMEI
ncbi:MAG: phenylalanine--tRNA ligase subunit beta [Candidatus Diapherotrites archaeon]